MRKRVTIAIDDELDKKLHALQAKLIMQESRSVSLSKVINDILRKNPR